MTSAERLSTINAILIALLTAVAALVAWRASVADDGAGDEDFAGLQATVNAEETRALNYVQGMEHYGGFINYHRHAQLSDALEKSNAKASALEGELATANLDQFPARYLNRDGTYSVNRELGVLWQDASKVQDMDSESHFVESDRFRQQSLRLSLAVVVITLALVLLTLVETVPAGLQGLLVVLGGLVGVGGSVWAVLIELGR